MRALGTVTGQDRVGIIASVCNLLAERNINILDINQTVMEEFFTMAMLVDTCSCTCSYEELRSALHDSGEQLGLSIRIQREDIFRAMHRI